MSYKKNTVLIPEEKEFELPRGLSLIDLALKSKKDVKKNIPSDEDLIERFQKGDEYAYEQIVKRYKDRLINFAYRYFGNIEDAQDAVQETFLRVYIHKNSYRRIAKFSTWLYTITRNLTRTELNRKNRKKIFSINKIIFEDKEFEIPDKDIGPEENTHNIIRDELIQKAMGSL